MSFPMRGMLIPLDGGGGPVLFQWNPGSISGPTTNAEYAVMCTAGNDKPYVQYSHGKESGISFDLDLFRGETGWEVNANWLALRALTIPVVSGMTMKRPPKVKLVFGMFLNETVVVTEITPTFDTLFGPITLQPYKARIGIKLLIVRE